MKQRKAKASYQRGLLLSLLTVPALLMPNAGIVKLTEAKAAEISGRVLYVAENGNDAGGNGSSQSPYRSIKKAAAEATAGTTILIRPAISQQIRKTNAIPRIITAPAGEACIFSSLKLKLF